MERHDRDVDPSARQRRPPSGPDSRPAPEPGAAGNQLLSGIGNAGVGRLLDGEEVATSRSGQSIGERVTAAIRNRRPDPRTGSGGAAQATGAGLQRQDESHEPAGREPTAHDICEAPEEFLAMLDMRSYLLALEEEGRVPEGLADRFVADWEQALTIDDPFELVHFLHDNGWISSMEFGRRLGDIHRARLSDDQPVMLGSGRVVPRYYVERAKAAEAMLADLHELDQIGIASNPGAAMAYIFANAVYEGEEQRRDFARVGGAAWDLFGARSAPTSSRRGPGMPRNEDPTSGVASPVVRDNRGRLEPSGRSGHSAGGVDAPSRVNDRYTDMAREAGVPD